MMHLYKFFQKYWFHIFGSFFVIAQLFILSALLFDEALRLFLLWSCNNFCILLAYACYKKNMQMLKGVSYLGLVSQIIWVADFNSHFLGFNLSGVSDYIFTEGFTYPNEVSVALHIIVPIAVLLMSFKVKPEIRSIVYASLYAIILYSVTILLGPQSEDINCVFTGCGNNQYLPYNIYVWPLYALISILLSYSIHYFLYGVWNIVKHLHIKYNFLLR